jgi:selenocysteine lyase/cysteine desulfurase
MPDVARRFDVSVPWLSAAGARKSLELLVSLGNDRIAEHNLGLARSLTSKLGLPEPESPIVRFQVANADEAARNLVEAGIACAVRAGSVRLSFHLYNDEQDVELAVAALAT